MPHSPSASPQVSSLSSHPSKSQSSHLTFGSPPGLHSVPSSFSSQALSSSSGPLLCQSPQLTSAWSHLLCFSSLLPCLSASPQASSSSSDPLQILSSHVASSPRLALWISSLPLSPSASPQVLSLSSHPSQSRSSHLTSCSPHGLHFLQPSPSASPQTCSLSSHPLLILSLAVSCHFHLWSLHCFSTPLLHV